MRQGFSLLELSIVLVIIGLLAGGIIVGSDMIRASELRSIVAQKDQYITAVKAFRDQYMALPGDMMNATSFWGTASGGCPDGTGTGTQTCNGDGDGLVDNDTNEMYRFWQQLVNAGLIEGQFTGVKNHATVYMYCTAGVNCPVTKINGSTFGFRYPGMDAGSAAWFASTYGHLFEFGGDTYWPTSVANVLTAKEAWSIDTKIDDGKPAYGNVMGMKSAYWGGNCVTTDVADTAAWAVSAVTYSCGLHFKSGF